MDNSISTLIDWISVTYRESDYRAHFENLGLPGSTTVLECSTLDTSDWLLTKGLHAYHEGARSALGTRALWNIPVDRQGWHISYSGSALNHFDALDLIKIHIDRGGKFTRLDLAVDTRGIGLSLKTLQGLFVEGACKSAAKEWQYRESSKGETLEIGVRSSERFLRIYDKGAEQGGAWGQWYRIEIELKRRVADGVARHFAGEGNMSAIAGIIRDFADFDDPAWKQAFENVGPVRVTSVRGKTNTEKWLMNQVSKALARYCLDNAGFWYDFVDKVDDEVRAERDRRRGDQNRMDQSSNLTD